MDIDDFAKLVRLLDYIIIMLVATFRAAHNWTRSSVLVSMLHLFIALIMLAFFQSVIFRQEWFILYVITPMLTALAIMAAIYMIRQVRNRK